MRHASLAAALAAVALGLTACGGSGGGSGGGQKSAAAGIPRGPVTSGGIDPANFTANVDNEFFPLKPGSTWRYRGIRDGKHVTETIVVQRRTARVAGAPVVVISDRLDADGHPAEVTTDWYTQDRQGNVWYFGEDTKTLDAKGHVLDRDGSWQTGVDGARPGIFMPAHPVVGRTYAQEHYKGHAEDHFTVVGLGAAVKVPALTSAKGLRTTERTPLEPDVVDSKVYVRGIGTVLEQQLKGPGSEHLELVSFQGG